MLNRMTRRAARGFTLLEVMIATGILAVGSISVILVLATAAGFASKRQGEQRLAEVVEEALGDARDEVDRFRPTKDDKLPGGPPPTTAAKSGRPAPKAQPGTAPAAPAEEGKILGTASTRYSGYAYDLSFSHVDPNVPEKGYLALVTVHYGDGLTREETAVVTPSTIPMEEFSHSTTWEEEQKGKADSDKVRETR